MSPKQILYQLVAKKEQGSLEEVEFDLKNDQLQRSL